MDDDSYEPYIPVAQRKQAKLAALASLGLDERRLLSASQSRAKSTDRQEYEEDDSEEVTKEKARLERTLLVEAQDVHRKKATEGMCCL